MLRNLPATLLFLGLFTITALAQAPETNSKNSSAPSAWVYVSGRIGSSTDTAEVHAYSAASNGKLTALAGSPFSADVADMAVHGKYLFGAGNFSTFIETYAIESDGALHYTARVNSQAKNMCSSYPGPIVLDHTGASLYNFDYWGDTICSNSVYQAYSVEKSNGSLKYLNDAGGDQELAGPLTFSSNNDYAYTSDCYHSSPAISGFKRNSNGSLTMLTYDFPFPSGGWCPYLAAADPAMHLAVPMYPSEGYGEQNGPYQLAAYTIESDGNLTTKSKSATMPKVAVNYVTALSMSPSGKLLAVAGTSGLQIFHFNGAEPVKTYTGLLTSSEVDEVSWDNDNHLYAISNSANKLWVFNVTPSSYSLVARYSVNQPIGLTVLPRP